MKQIGKLTMMLFALLLWTGCSEETTKGGGGETPQPDGNTQPPREVMLTLNNELKLMKTHTKVGGDTPIATTEENAIASLDVFVFGCATEEGDYTFQEMFSYRADDTADLPRGATALELTPTDDTNKQTKGLLKLKKGLFVKLYCIANCTSLTDPAGDPVDYADFVPLTFTKPEEAGTDVATEGKPSETEFISYHTPLLQAGKADDILLTPLAMSGAYTIPLDLTDFSTSSRLQIGFKLTRVAARFDIINEADESKFTIREISMGNGRRGSTFFPIRIYGDTPIPKDGELITYPVRPFDGAKANTGTQTGAFYSYPSPSGDKGFLILKGTYQTNKTDLQEVSYQIPFTQTDAQGNSTTLEINNNHRYTIAITEADDYHLDFTLTVADWTDSGEIDDYNPSDGDNDKLTIDIPPTFTDTKYDATTKTVSVSLKADSKFTVNIGTNAALSVQKTYVGGLDAQQYDWIDISDPAIATTTKAAQTSYGYTLSPKKDYDKKRYPRCIVRFTNTMNGSETVLFVEAQAAPQAYAVSQDPDNRNTFDAELLQATMYRVTGSKVKLKIICPDGTTVKSQPDWLDVTAVTNTPPETIYEFKLKDADRDTEITDNKGTVILQNAIKTDLETAVTVILSDASITPDFTSLGGADNTYENPNGTTPGNVNMTLSEGNTFKISSLSLDGIRVGIEYEGGPEWLKHDGESALTKAGSNRNTITFSQKNDELAKGQAQKATVTLQNKSGGIDYIFTVTPVFKAPIVTLVANTASPTQNSFNGTTANLYQVTGSQIQIKASALGGSSIQNITGVTVTGGDSYTTDNTYTVTWDGKTTSSGSFDIVNKSDKNKNTTITVNLPSAAITANDQSITAANSGTTDIAVTAAEGVTATVLNDNWNGGGQWFDITKNDLDGNGNIVITQRNNVNTIMKPVTIRLTNKIAGGGNKDITITPTNFTISLSATSGQDNDYYLNTTNTITFNTTSAGGAANVTSSNTSIATVSQSNNTLTVIPKGLGSCTITVSNASDNSKKTTYSVKVSGKTYNGKAVWKYYGFYIAPENAASQVGWTNSLTSTYCSNRSGASWFVPTSDQWNIINGDTSGNTSSAFSEYKKNNIFSDAETYYWGSNESNTSNAYCLVFYSDQAYVGLGPKSVLRYVRCVAK